MIARVTGLRAPILLGFGMIGRGETLASPAGYPPYNIERLLNRGGEAEILRITFAVAGFNEDQLEVMVEDGQLVIRGRQTEEPPRDYLHRGIATRQFQKTFVLAEGVEILGADLQNGLLSVDLVRRETRSEVRKINIANGAANGRAVRQGGAS